MASSVALSTVALASLVVVGASIIGGWIPHDPKSNPKYLELAHYAVSQRVEGLEYYDTVLELKKAATQIVDGINYRLTFTIAGSSCKIGKVVYSEKRCPPINTEAKATCTALVYEGVYLLSSRRLSSLNCA